MSLLQSAMEHKSHFNKDEALIRMIALGITMKKKMALNSTAIEMEYSMYQLQLILKNQENGTLTIVVQ